MMTKQIKNSARQRGFSLLDVVLALVVSAIALMWTIRDNIGKTELTAVEKAAKDLALIGEAGKAYVTAQGGPSGALTTMPTATVLVELSTLQAAGSCGATACLSSTASDFVAPGQAASNRYVMRVNRQGTPGNYSYIAAVYTVKPWTAGGVRRLDLAGAAVRKVGGNALLANAAGSMSTMGSTGTGSPTITSTDFPELTAIAQLGYFASGGNPNINDSIYLRRDGLYPMTGNLNMGSNSINAANAVNATTVAATGNVTAAAVSATGAITADAVTATNDVQGKIVRATQEVRTGAVIATGDITTDGRVVIGPTGDIVANSLSGTNKSVVSRLGQAAPMSSVSYVLSGTTPTATIAKPTCPSGATALLQLTNNSAAGGVYSARWGLQVQVTSNASSWGLQLLRATVPTATAPSSTDPDGVAGVAIAYCAF